MLAEQQQFDEADNTYKKALEIEPNNGTNIVQRGCETRVQSVHGLIVGLRIS